LEIESPTLKKLLEEEAIIVTADGVKRLHILSDVQLITMGAEAYIYKAKFMDIDAIIKWRFPKNYMPKDLDEIIRRNRTELEAKMLWKAHSLGIKAPIPLYIDLDEGILIMTFIQGHNFRDIANIIDVDKLCNIVKTVGIYTAKLHLSGVVHGDLTTSNIIVDNDSVYLIDFGLATISKRLEDIAIDVHIFFRSIESAHPTIEEIAKRCFIDGYKQVVGEDRLRVVLKAVENIRLRGRYIAARKLRTEWGF
jgi:TP53 regulating kinase-like protein